MFVIDVVDTVKEVLDDCLPSLPMWIVYRSYGRLTVCVYAPFRSLMIVSQSLYR